MKNKLKKLGEIDFTKVESYEYSLSDYFNDVSFYEVASHYLKLNHLRDRIYDYELHIKGESEDKTHNLRIDNERNNCLLDYKPIAVEQMVMVLETHTLDMDGSVDTNEIIKKITGLDLNNYISHVWYEGGGEDYIQIVHKKEKR